MRVLNVTAQGAQEGWSYLAQRLLAMKPEGFIALDTEFSGLCSPQRIENCDLAERYAALSELTNERAMLSLGISLFNPSETSHTYEVTTMDFLLNCTSKYNIAHDTGAFLVSHGFDFNSMYSRGIEYRRACDEVKEVTAGKKKRKDGTRCEWGPWPRRLLWRLGRAGIPIIVHNGFIDLLFLYSSFEGSLPKTLGGFVAALVDCLPAGVFDTKLLAMGPAKDTRTFLSYLYARSVMDQKVRVIEPKNVPVAQKFDPSMLEIEKRDELCLLFAANGSCRRGAKCPLSHDAFKVVEVVRAGKLPTDVREERKLGNKQHRELKKRQNEKIANSLPTKLNKKARKRLWAAAKAKKEAVGEKFRISVLQNGEVQSFVKHENNANCTTKEVGKKRNSDEMHCNSNEKLVAKKAKVGTVSKEGVSSAIGPFIENGGTEISTRTEDLMVNTKEHSAGYDAFTTGYVFAYFRATLENKEVVQLHNRVRMMGKGRPLWLHKSKFNDGDEIKLANTERASR